ncbi:MAG TPA: DUF3995 domain-containing protein [Acidimicrobiales bacterium]
MPGADAGGRPAAGVPPRHRDRRRSATAITAAALGLANAAVSAYWLAGGTALLDTVGGDIEEWGRRRSAPVLVALAAVVAVKAVVAVSAPLYAGMGGGPARRLVALAAEPWARALGWVAATVLVAYGGVLTLAGLAVQAGVVAPAADADERALAWHAYLWDPWFLAWGVALAATLIVTASGRRRAHRRPARSVGPYLQ